MQMEEQVYQDPIPQLFAVLKCILCVLVVRSGSTLCEEFYEMFADLYDADANMMVAPH